MLRSFFSTYHISPKQGGFFPCYSSKEEHFNAKMSCLVGLSKKLHDCFQKTGFNLFWLRRSTFKVEILNARGKIQKTSVYFPGETGGL